MKSLLKATAAVIALSAVMAAPSFAAVSGSELDQSIKEAMAASPSVQATERNGVVTLTGNYDDAGDEFAAINAAKSVDGVKKVINLGLQSN